jgi:hypothetical protein
MSFATAIFLAGCVAVPDVTNQSRATGVSAEKFRTAAESASVCMMNLPDQSFGGEVYAGSGSALTQRIQSAIKSAGWSVVRIPDSGESLNKACAKHGSEIVFETIVDRYEDNLTGWSGKPDRIGLLLRVNLASNPEQKREIFFDAKSNVAASGLLEWGNAKPTELLKEDFDYSVNRLLRELRRR